MLRVSKINCEYYPRTFDFQMLLAYVSGEPMFSYAYLVMDCPLVCLKSSSNNLQMKLFKMCPTKEARKYNGEKTASSISGAGKTGQLHVKE